MWWLWSFFGGGGGGGSRGYSGSSDGCGVNRWMDERMRGEGEGGRKKARERIEHLNVPVRVGGSEGELRNVERAGMGAKDATEPA